MIIIKVRKLEVGPYPHVRILLQLVLVVMLFVLFCACRWSGKPATGLYVLWSCTDDELQCYGFITGYYNSLVSGVVNYQPH